ncbi:MAG: ribonuclease P protein subunit [Nanoarchaeota archaeon]|nr:ribonuclease P protein subunit [Nanoarchaeota archaeon]
MIKNILKHELIGLGAKVIGSTNKADIGIKGIIIDETKNTITILEKDEKKKLIKKNIILEIEYEGKKIHVEGKLIAKRPEDRIKAK